MDFKNSIRPLFKYWWVIGLSVLVVIVALILVDKLQSQEYEGTTTLVVKQIVLPSTEGDYGYDGYYAVMANQSFADTIEGWLKSPEMVAEIYEQAKIDYPKNMSTLQARFDVDKVVSQSIAMKMKAGSKEEAELLLKSAQTVVKERVETMLVDKEGKPLFTVINTPVLVLPYAIDYRVQFGVGIMGALCVGVFLVYLLEAIAKED